MKWVYGIQSGEFIKVGLATDIAARLETLRLYNPHPVKVVLRIYSEHAGFIERTMHRLLANHSVGREWFRASREQVEAVARLAVQESIKRHDRQREWEKWSAEHAEVKRMAREARARARDERRQAREDAREASRLAWEASRGRDVESTTNAN